MTTIIGVVGIVMQFVIVLTTIQSQKTKGRNIALKCATHEFKIKHM